MVDEPNNDIQLLELLKSTNREDNNKAFIMLYKKYFEMVYAMIRLNNGYRREAEDVFQDTMVALYQNVRKGLFKGESRLSTYIYSIAKYRWLKQMKKFRREELFEDLSYFEACYETQVWQENGKLLKLMNSVLDQIDLRCRLLLKYFYFDKLSYAEISKELGFLNDETAKSKKFRCIQKIIKLLENNSELKNELETCLF